MNKEQKTKNIAIIGAGLVGLSAAYDLLAAGHEVTIFEADARPGGLAAGFDDPNWDWPLEKFYHHIFEKDDAIIEMVDELGMRDKLFFPAPVTSIWHEGKIRPYSNPRDWFRFYNLVDFVRFGTVGAFLRFTKMWRMLERHSADEWTRRWFGKRIYRVLWKPLLIGKFGKHYKNVNMAWLWARLYARSFKLGYFEGGFQAFVDKLAAAVRSRGGDIRLNTPVTAVEEAEHGLKIHTESGEFLFDSALHTTSPGLLQHLCPSLPESYLGDIRKLKSMSAVVLTLALNQSLLTDGTYWLNLPAETPDKTDADIPFLALVEHTNYISREHYGGDHIVYCGDYVLPDHEYMTMPEAELEKRFIAALKHINPAFNASWIRKRWLYKARYAQPVPELNHSRRVPDLRTPIQGLYFASMSHVYPWDRGTNFAVQIGRKVAGLILEDTQ